MNLADEIHALVTEPVEEVSDPSPPPAAAPTSGGSTQTPPKLGPAKRQKLPESPYARAKLALSPMDVPKLKGHIEVVPTQAEREDPNHVCTGGSACRTKHKRSLKPGHARGVDKRHYSIGWRAELEKQVGPSGEELWSILLNVARGRPTEVNDKRSGKTSLIVPQASDQVRAAVELAHMLVGKPVTQAEIMASQKASSDLAAVQGLSDDDLRRRVAKILVDNVTAGATDAEVLP